MIDARNARFRMSRKAGSAGGGLVDGYRYGVLDSGEARIVIDVENGTQVGKIVRRKLRDNLHKLSISLINGKSTAQQAPCDGVAGPVRQASALGSGLSAEARRKSQPSKPVVVIDPGHGGIDPGAVVNKVYLEKIIALAVARRLAKRLRKIKRFNVVMTRDGDTFVSLDGRVERARSSKADLFISLHADSLDDTEQAKQTHGAAVYILSHQASDAEARRLAEKENAADLLAGILPSKTTEDGVRDILVDLLKRETERESARLRRLLVAKMRPKVVVSRKPLRSAAFRVLKQTETPAALIELGYMTNAADLRRMRRADWQDRMAVAVAAAIEQFFLEK
ncbi:MAG: N-acetylmuramoyl-L-alanine amidase family protein [Hyphomicrobiaceae bacterium]